MEKLSGIARDYLHDLEILLEAQDVFYRELGKWWPELVGSLKLALEKKAGKTVESWDNSASPGQLRVRLASGEHLLDLELLDPRICRHPLYQISLISPNQPQLKKLRRSDAILAKLADYAQKAGLPNLAIDRGAAKLLAIEIMIDPDDPQKTFAQVIATGEKLFDMILLSQAS